MLDIPQPSIPTMPYVSEHPTDYPRRILVAVTGLSPQIVTETLYALAVAPAQTAFVPTEIHLITTRSGAEKARLALLSDEPGWFHHLCRDYPTPASHVLELPGGRLVDTASAQVALAELPFVSLRHGLPEALLTGRASYHQTVEAARRALAPPLLQLDLASRRVRAAGKIFALPPAELALLSVFARRALHGEEALPAPAKELRDVEWRRCYFVELRWIDGPLGERDDTERALKKGMDGSYFSTHLSKLRKILKRELGPAATPYLISDGGSRPRRYRLDLPPAAMWYGPLETTVSLTTDLEDN